MNAQTLPLTPARDAEVAKLVRLINSHFGCYAERVGIDGIRVIDSKTMLQTVLPGRRADVMRWLGY